MLIHVAPFDPGFRPADALVLFVPEDGPLPAAVAAVDVGLNGTMAIVREAGDFRGKAREGLMLYGPASGPRRVALTGLGKAHKLTLEKLRDATGQAMIRCRERGAKSVAVALFHPDELTWEGSPPSLEALAQAVAEAAQLVLYQFHDYRTTEQEDMNVIDELVLLLPAGSTAAEVEPAIARSRVLAESVAIARTWILHPGDVMTPTQLAEAAARMGREVGLDVSVLDAAELARRGFGALLAVGQGSAEPPCLIGVAWHGGDPAEKPIAIVGKGVTFDTGGIGIKPGPGMEKMKYDMAGGAATLAILRAVALLKLPLNVVGIVAAAENMPSATAIKPGDVVTSYKGLTIEINDTDAEGRVVLADALAYAVRDLEAQAIIDMATLTGAVAVALGRDVMGVMGNQQALVDRVIAAGERSGERGWQLPLFEIYDDFLTSEIADLKNYGGRYAGTVAAASFLQRFVDETPWVHLDIAGVGWADAERGFRPKGPTGSPVRLVVELLSAWQPLGLAAPVAR